MFAWTAYRIFFLFPEWVDECIAKPVVWLGPLVYLQKNYIKTILQSIKKDIVRNSLFGFSVGLLYFILYTVLSRVSMGLPLVNPDHLSALQLVLQIIIALFTGCVEELLFRKFILERALLLFHDSIIANSFSSLLFTLIHLPIILFVYKYSVPITISYLALLFISGFVYGAVYLKNRSVGASAITHAVWNFLGTILR